MVFAFYSRYQPRVWVGELGWKFIPGPPMVVLETRIFGDKEEENESVFCTLTRLKKWQDGLQTLDGIRDDRDGEFALCRGHSPWCCKLGHDSFNEVSLHHRLHDIYILTWAGYSGETRSTDTSSEARPLPLIVRGRIVAIASRQGPHIIQ